MVKGNDIIILLNGTAIAGTKSHRVSTSCGTLEKTSSTQQKWREYEPDRCDWSISVNKLVTLVSDIDSVLLVGTKVTLIVRDRNNTKSLTGSAIVTACETSYVKGNLATGSYSFKGTGALTSGT